MCNISCLSGGKAQREMISISNGWMQSTSEPSKRPHNSVNVTTKRQIGPVKRWFKRRASGSEHQNVPKSANPKSLKPTLPMWPLQSLWDWQSRAYSLTAYSGPIWKFAPFYTSGAAKYHWLPWSVATSGEARTAQDTWFSGLGCFSFVASADQGGVQVWCCCGMVEPCRQNAWARRKWVTCRNCTQKNFGMVVPCNQLPKSRLCLSWIQILTENTDLHPMG